MTAVTQDTALRPARPTLRVGGQDQPGLVDGLLRLLVHETADGLSRCEATFGNWGPRGARSDLLHLDRRLLDFGAALAVVLGDRSLFDGRISALEGDFPEGAAPSVTVLAEDRFEDLRTTRRTRTFVDVTDAEVAAQLAREHGMTPDVDLPGPRHRVLAQLNRSDLAFLRDRARSAGAEVSVSGTTLSVRRRPGRGGAPLVLVHGGDLRQVRITADLAGQRSSVVVTGWDVGGKTGLCESATDSALAGELDGLDSGAAVLRGRSAARPDHVVDAVPSTSAEARARAEALFLRAARRFVVAHGVAQTVAGLRVGATVRLDRLGPLLGGDYYVSEVRHRFDGASGLRSEFVAERPGVGRP